MQGKVEICGVNTAALPVLRSAETRELLEKARAGDGGAREKLIYGNLRLVLSVVQRFSGRGESMDDLFQVGVIGLIKAVDAFDLGQNVQFSTYGVPMIAGELRRFLRDHSALRVSRSMRDTACEPVSLYEPVFSDGGESACLMDQLGDSRNGDEHWIEQIALEEAIGRLSPRERRILALRFYDGRTQTEVAREIGISQAQVSRLEKGAIRQIKKNISA